MHYEDMTLKRAKKVPGCKYLYLEHGSIMYEVLHGDPENFLCVMNYGKNDSKKDREDRILVRIMFADDGTPAAWAWMLPYNYSELKTNIKRNRFAFMVYVKPEHRKLKIATKLYGWAKEVAAKKHKAFVVFKHDKRSKIFYNSVKSKHNLEFF